MQPKFRHLIYLIALGLAALFSSAALAQGAPSRQATVRPFEFENDSTFEFGIYDRQGQRFATAYYRILREKTGERNAWRFKYVGRNDRLSESAECWVSADSFLPLRSSRKVISGEKTTFFDVAYDQQKIIYRKKIGEAGKVEEQQFPAQTKFYDYESLIWLVPQLDFGEKTQLSIGLFDTLNVLPMTLVVNSEGASEISVGSHSYPAKLYSFNIGSTPYKLYAVNQGGQMLPGRVDMAQISFLNLSLDPKKVKEGSAKSIEKPKAETPPPAKPKPEAKPKPQPPAEGENEDGEKEEEGAPAENPLGPPPKGGRF